MSRFLTRLIFLWECRKQVASGSKSLWNMYSKQQHAVLAYVQQAVYSSNERCSKQQLQQHDKQPYSYLQKAPAPHNYCYCMQFKSSSSSTLLAIPPYIA